MSQMAVGFSNALKTISHSVAVSIQETASQLTDELPAYNSIQFMYLSINHFATVTIMYYSSIQVNYMVTVFIR